MAKITFVGTSNVQTFAGLEIIRKELPEIAKVSSYSEAFRSIKDITTGEWAEPFIEVTDTDSGIAQRLGVVLNTTTGLEVHILNPIILSAKPIL